MIVLLLKNTSSVTESEVELVQIVPVCFRGIIEERVCFSMSSVGEPNQTLFERFYNVPLLLQRS